MGIINGWDDDTLEELAMIHNWTAEEAKRLSKLRKQFLEA